MDRIVLCISLAYLLALQVLPKLGERRISPFRMNWIKPEFFSLLHRNVADSKHMDKFMLALNFPQVLPYVVIKHNDMYLTYSRKRGEETRLHGTRSIGFGGHIDIKDMKDLTEFDSVIMEACNRELKEEIGLRLDNFKERLVFNWAMVDYTNTVGMVHYGLFAVVELRSEEFYSLNIDPNEISDAQWQSAVQLKLSAEMYESWSQALILNEANTNMVK